MGNVSSDALLYVKEDLILPQDISFYDLIATRARGKSGPLFNFDVHEDVRLGAIDARVEKDESHPGKGKTAVSIVYGSTYHILTNGLAH